MTSFGPRAEAGARELRFAAVVTGVFVLVVGVVLARHEMWRDELQAWMLARDSASLAELWRNTRYEGHAPLWFVLLFGVSRLTRNPVAMQVLHGVLAAAVAFLIAWRAPFSRAWRALIPFGYYFAYGWAVVSRPYVIGALFLVLWCVERRERPRAVWLPAVLLALVANTSVYGALIAAAAAASMLVAWWRDGTWRCPADRLRAAAASGVVVLGATAAALWVLPPRGYVSSNNLVGDDPVRSAEWAALSPFRAFAPVAAVQDPEIGWRGNSFLYSGGPRRRQAAIAAGALLLFAALAGLRRSPEGLTLAGLHAVMYVTFGTVVHRSASYHDGYVILALLGGYWLAGRPARAFESLGAAALVLQAAAAALMLAADAVLPFSGAREAAAFLERTGRSARPIVSPSHASIAVAGYLDRPIFYPDRGEQSTFARWNRSVGRFTTEGLEAMTVAGARQRAADSRGAVLIVRRPLPRSAMGASVTLARAFDRALVPDERLWVYDVRGPSGAAALTPQNGDAVRAGATRAPR